MDAVEQPYRTPGRARGDLEFGVQSPGVIALSIRRVFVEPGCLPDALGEIFREVADVSACFLGATRDALDVRLSPEPDDMGGYG